MKSSRVLLCLLFFVYYSPFHEAFWRMASSRSSISSRGETSWLLNSVNNPKDIDSLSCNSIVPIGLYINDSSMTKFKNSTVDSKILGSPVEFLKIMAGELKFIAILSAINTYNETFGCTKIRKEFIIPFSSNYPSSLQGIFPVLFLVNSLTYAFNIFYLY